jgi:hypothetical protein
MRSAFASLLRMGATVRPRLPVAGSVVVAHRRFSIASGKTPVDSRVLTATLLVHCQHLGAVVRSSSPLESTVAVQFLNVLHELVEAGVSPAALQLDEGADSDWDMIVGHVITRGIKSSDVDSMRQSGQALAWVVSPATRVSLACQLLDEYQRRSMVGESVAVFKVLAAAARLLHKPACQHAQRIITTLLEHNNSHDAIVVAATLGFPWMRTSAMNQITRWLLQRKQHAEAIAHITTSFALPAEQVPWLNILATQHLDAGRYADAAQVVHLLKNVADQVRPRVGCGKVG